MIKIGSSLLVDPDDRTPRTTWLASLARDIADMRTGGVRVIVVSSGAVALGWRQLGMQRSPQLDHRQAAAAVGQSLLMNAWAGAFAAQDIAVAQLLLTYDDSESAQRSANARATLAVLLEAGVLPVVNENDSVATEELKLGDNDRLSALVAELAGADLLLLLSDVDGLYDRAPDDPEARHIPFVSTIDDRIAAMAGGAAQGANTTIAIVATDAALTQAQCTRMATAAHDGMARALVPSHTPLDGDLIFAAATGEKPLTDPLADTLMLGHAAALCVARAIARGVYEARAEAGDMKPCWRSRFR